MSEEIITVKDCYDCPLRKYDDCENPYCGMDKTIEFYTAGGGYEHFPIGCPLCDGKIYVICKFYNGKGEYA